MEPSHSSQHSYSTPRSNSSPVSKSRSQSASATSKKTNDNSRSDLTERSDYSNTFQSSSRSAKKTSPPPDQDVSVNMNNTGESTRSLLSVLSHSSVDSLSTGSLTDSSTTSSPARGGSDSKAIDQSRDISTNQEQEPALTHWEKWLIEKTKLERKKVREEVRKKLAELKAKEEQEQRNRERRRHIESQVVEWLKEKEKEEKKQRAKEARRKQKEENEKNMMRQKQLEKDKVNRQEWMLKKKKEEKMMRERAQEEERRKAMEERRRKEKADEAFKTWKKQARHRPKPDTGAFHHYGGRLHSAPSYCNPIPWIPNDIPSDPKPVKCSRSSSKRKSSQAGERQIIQSPPLLFKDRSNSETFKRWGRPR